MQTLIGSNDLGSFIFTYSYVFIFGACLGSFFMVVGLRLPQKENLITPSHCDNCQTRLKPWHLIPLVGYLVLRGKCSNCHQKIPAIYPLFELLTGTLFTLIVYLMRFNQETIIALLFISLLLTCTVSDISSRKILNSITYPAFILFLILRLTVSQLNPWWFALVGAGIGFTILLLLGLLSFAMLKQKGMGGGDIKLFTVVGVVIGPFPVLVVLVSASVLSLLYVSVDFMITKKLKRKLPFGPFIALAALLVYIYISGMWDQVIRLF
ncbi:prepilin peptidase [Lactococcus carnosus]|uniref:prepilin peptidase n=1 Tax=Pseudolactococcus carnosus TaxID=2749961 RepID=UPI001FBB3539|nr:A24 family peptidase [Lactococcus carnosus]MCJ1979736.1 prepilin peptidase [Lactococcus carnosus]